MNRAERRLLKKTSRLEYKAECKEKRADKGRNQS